MTVEELIKMLVDYDYSNLEVTKVIDFVTYMLPFVLGPILAKTVNKNSKQWKEWTGVFGKVVGLLVSLSDIFRTPGSIAKDVKGEKTVRYDAQK